VLRFQKQTGRHKDGPLSKTLFGSRRRQRNNDAMPTYTSPPAPASPRRKPDRPAGKTFAIDFQRPQALTKSEQREMLASAFANTAAIKIQPVKSKRGGP
jgi:hypothetical protein